MELVLEV